MLVNIPHGVQPGKPFVANFYGIEYEVECPAGKAEGTELEVEIEDYRGRRPRRCTVVIPGGCYPGEPMIIAADASSGDGKIEEQNTNYKFENFTVESVLLNPLYYISYIFILLYRWKHPNPETPKSGSPI